MKLSEIDNTIANKIIKSDLPARMQTLSFTEIKNEMLFILNEESTSISKKTYYKWNNKINQVNNKNEIMFTICNIVLAADDLSTDLKHKSKENK